jgi:hypothetical protein
MLAPLPLASTILTANLVRSVAAIVGFVSLMIPLVRERRTRPDDTR